MIATGLHNKLRNSAAQVKARGGLNAVLSGYGDLYLVRDLRRRAKKEPGDVKSLSTQNLEIKLSEKAPKNYVGPLEVKNIETEHLKVDFYFDEKGNYYYSDYPRGYFFNREKERVYNTNDYCINSDDSISYRKQIIIPYSRFFDNAKNDNFIIKFKVDSINYVNWKVSGSSATCYVPVSDIATPYLAELNNIISNTSKNSYNNKIAVILKNEILQMLSQLGVKITDSEKSEKQNSKEKATSSLVLLLKDKTDLDKFPAKVYTEIMGSDGERTNYVAIPTTVKKGDLFNLAIDKANNHEKRFGFAYRATAKVTPETWKRLRIDAAYKYGQSANAEMKKVINSFISQVYYNRIGQDGAFDLNEYTVNGLGKPTIKFEFETNDELKEFLKENKENLIDSYIDVTPEGDERRAKLRGASLPSEFFNCAESDLFTDGMKPTYKRLADYSVLIGQAKNQGILRGYGFDKTTLNLLKKVVVENWRSVQKLADHLKADTEKQSAFNVWHWLHCNIKYDYDAPGREEIRTPQRSWADRGRGVDCDCLSVFAYCLFLCMGYRPKYEIVAFKNAKKFSHIYVNLNGLAVDRVLPAFGQRPLFITNTLIMEIPVYELNGCSGAALAGLRGVYEKALQKVNNNTATAADRLDMQKSKILISLAGQDYNGYRLGALIMPHVVAIDKQGAYYFTNGEIARLAAEAENSILDAEKRGASAEELNGIFKNIGKAFKKVGTAVAKVVAAPVTATVKATQASVNLVKAGVQAVSGNTAAAKETMQKVGEQAKAAVVDPVKTNVEATKTIVKETIVNPVKSTVQIAGKVFKVIFIKINPVTVLMRNALRALIAINFLGIATRLNLANTLANVPDSMWPSVPYTKEQFEAAKKAKKKVVNFFTKMGGKAENIEKTIQKGAGRKALFKKDYSNDTKITITDDDAVLGEAGTIGACLAAVGTFFAKIWGWVKNVVPKVVEFVKEHKDEIKTGAEVAQTLLSKKDSDGSAPETEIASESSTTLVEETTENKGGINPWLIGGAFAVGALALMNGKKKKKKRR